MYSIKGSVREMEGHIHRQTQAHKGVQLLFQVKVNSKSCFSLISQVPSGPQAIPVRYFRLCYSQGTSSVFTREVIIWLGSEVRGRERKNE